MTWRQASCDPQPGLQQRSRERVKERGPAIKPCRAVGPTRQPTPRYTRTFVDLGAVDGAAVARAARNEPGVLAIGVDTDAGGLHAVSRRAARPPARGGLTNAAFLVGDASVALAALRGRVDEVRITLPWGSLLRAVVQGERAFALAVAGSL